MQGSEIRSLGSGHSVRALVVLGLVVLLGLESAFLGFHQLRLIEQTEATRQFDALAEERSHALRTELAAVVSAFDVFASRWGTSTTRSQEAFSALALSQVCPFASVTTTAWAPRITGGDKPEYFPILWLRRDAAGPGPIAVGADIAADPRLRAAFDEATTQRSLAVTTVPAAAASDTATVLLLRALFATPSDPAIASVEGIVAAELDLRLLVDAALAKLSAAPLSLSILDNAGGEAVSLYTAAPATSDSAATAPALRHRSSVTLGGHQWTILATTGPAFVAARRTMLPWVALIAILALTLAALAFVRAQQTGAEHIAQDLRSGTRELISTRRALDRVEAMQSAILDSAGTAIIATDLQGIARIFNKAAERNFGWRADEMIGKRNPVDLFDPAQLAERAPVAAERLGRAVARPFDVCLGYSAPGTAAEWTVLGKDGTRFQELISFSTVEESPGVVVGFLGMGHDISERVRAEQALAMANSELERKVQERTADLSRSYETAREAAREARSTLDAMSAHVCIVEEDGRISATNTAWSAFGARNRGAGVPIGEGSNYLEACDRAAAEGCREAEEVAAALRDILAGRRATYDCEYPCHTPEEPRWFQCHARRFTVPEGQLTVATPARAVVAHNDVTGIKLAQLEAEHRRDLLWSLAESSPIGIFVTDRQARIRPLNPHAEEIFGRPLGAPLAGPKWLELLHAEDRSTAIEAWQRLVDRRETIVFQVRVLRPDGSLRWAVVRAAPLQGQIEGEDFAVGTIVDVTDRTRIETGLRLLSTDLAHQRGTEFFRSAAKALAELTETDAVFIAVRSAEDSSRIHSLALVVDGEAEPDLEAALEGTPCAEVFDAEPRVFTDRVQERFPTAAMLGTLGAASYAGVPLWDSQHRPLGALVALGRQAMTEPESVVALLRVFSTRVGAEIERVRSESSFHALFEFAPDALLIVDRHGTIVRANRQVDAVFGYSSDELIGTSLENLVPDESRGRHVALREAYNRAPVRRAMGDRSGVLHARRRDGTNIPVDVSLSPLETDEGLMVVAAVRDITEQRRAELHREHERQAALLRAEVNEALSGARHLDTALQTCVEAIVARLRLPLAAIWLYDDAGGPLRQRACSDPSRSDALDQWIHPAVLEEVVRAGVRYRDGVRYGDGAASDKRQEFHDLRSTIVIPLTIETTRLGALAVANTTEVEEEAVEALDLVSGIVAASTARRRAEKKVRSLAADLEHRVAERTVELEAANKELEAFSASVSHDLRAPLRRIGGFTSMLREELGQQLQPSASEYLEIVSRSATEMGRLIDDLLAAARVSRADMKLVPVATQVLVREVIENLRPDTGARSIEWSVDSLPSVIGDQALLKQVFVNLLGNAVKYTRQREVAHIHVGIAGEENGRVILFVRDDGTGFDMAHARKLFGMFQRLHSHEEFEGTGIGLANVERILARHGGRVWAEAEPDRGATFYFTLRRASVA